jgi:hypothetical protein
MVESSLTESERIVEIEEECLCLNLEAAQQDEHVRCVLSEDRREPRRAELQRILGVGVDEFELNREGSAGWICSWVGSNPEGAN